MLGLWADMTKVAKEAGIAPDGHVFQLEQGTDVKRGTVGSQKKLISPYARNTEKR